MPARSNRSIQGLVMEMFFPPARPKLSSQGRAQSNRNSVQSHAVLPAFLIIAFVMVSWFGFFKFFHPALVKAERWDRWERFIGSQVTTTSSGLVGSPSIDKGVDIVYNPPFKLSSLDSQQRAVFDLVDDLPNHPERYGLNLLGLPPVGFDQNTQAVFDSLASTEGSLRQFNADGSLVTSDAGCVGVMQGCDTNICPTPMWKQLYTNIWCGAKAFQEQLRMWGGTFTYAVAGYKGLWQYSRDQNGNFLLDSSGNRLILRDSAGNPKIEKSYQEQVDRVFKNLTLVPRN